MHTDHDASQVKWIGYLSSTSVYGDWGGAWVDERSGSCMHIVEHLAQQNQLAVAPSTVKLYKAGSVCCSNVSVCELYICIYLIHRQTNAMHVSAFLQATNIYPAMPSAKPYTSCPHISCKSCC